MFSVSFTKRVGVGKHHLLLFLARTLQPNLKPLLPVGHTQQRSQTTRTWNHGLTKDHSVDKTLREMQLCFGKEVIKLGTPFLTHAPRQFQYFLLVLDFISARPHAAQTIKFCRLYFQVVATTGPAAWRMICARPATQNTRRLHLPPPVRQLYLTDLQLLLDLHTAAHRDHYI